MRQHPILLQHFRQRSNPHISKLIIIEHHRVKCRVSQQISTQKVHVNIVEFRWGEVYGADVLESDKFERRQ